MAQQAEGWKMTTREGGGGEEIHVVESEDLVFIAIRNAVERLHDAGYREIDIKIRARRADGTKSILAPLTFLLFLNNRYYRYNMADEVKCLKEADIKLS